MNSTQKRSVVFVLLTVLLVMPGCANRNITLPHIHGAGYTSDGKQLIIPAHAGLVAYSKDGWSHVDGPKHDYMGFSAVDTGFYSSGHPAEGSELQNPLGIVKSSDMGKTLEPLGLAGESDFHGMSAGYQSHAIYVLNSHPNSQMDAAGLYYSTDDGRTWTLSRMNGVADEITAIAAHPADERILAIGTKGGLYLSTDNGNQFDKILPDPDITAVTFSKQGELFAAAAQNPKLIRYNLESKSKTELNLPNLTRDDAVSYLAVNPTDAHEIAVTTFKNDVYITSNLGSGWSRIAEQGKAE